MNMAQKSYVEQMAPGSDDMNIVHDFCQKPNPPAERHLYNYSKYVGVLEEVSEWFVRMNQFQL